MANHASAVKRMRQNEKRKERNKMIKSKVNTLIKKVLSSDEKEKTEKYLKDAVSYIDKTVSKGKLHRNNAARKKAKLARYFNSLEK